jgi:hypothetical protein
MRPCLLPGGHVLANWLLPLVLGFWEAKWGAENVFSVARSSERPSTYDSLRVARVVTTRGAGYLCAMERARVRPQMGGFPM